MALTAPERHSQVGYDRLSATYLRYRHLEPLLCRVAVGRAFVQWLRVQDLARQPADAYVVSFPKCGRTWLRLLLGRAFCLHFGMDGNPLDLEGLAARRPGVPSLGLLHDDYPHWKRPADLLPDKREYAGRRVIFLARDPRDVVVSAYFQKTRREQEPLGSLSAFLRAPAGSLATLLAFYNVWARERAVPAAFLLLRYEDLHAATGRELCRALTFLGLSVSDSHVEDAVGFASFENMQALEARDAFRSHLLRPGDPSDPESFKVRRGKMGGHRDYLGAEDLAWLDAQVQARLDPFYGYT